jgi:hypothetical protein
MCSATPARKETTMIEQFHLTSAHEKCLRGQTITADEPSPVLCDFYWEFTVKLERIEPAGVTIDGPGILESHGKVPMQYPRYDEDE